MPTIRAAADADRPAIASLASEADLFPPEILPEIIAPYLSGASAEKWLVAVASGEVVGFVYAAVEAMADNVWNMRALAVSSGARGSGVGRALVDAIESKAKGDGGRSMLVDTSSADAFAATRAFYVGRGYGLEATIRDYWSPGDDKATFSKRL